jgi:hypothetical protein
MLLSRRLISQIALFIVSAVIMTASAYADVILTLSGTTSNPTLTATVTNSDSFTSGPGGVIDFFLPPNVFDILYVQKGPLGLTNPDEIRAPADGSYLNIVQLSEGDLSHFTLDASHPYTTSGALTGDPASSLAVLNGVTSTMSVETGSGPTTNVTFVYDISTVSSVPEPPSIVLLGSAVGMMTLMYRRKAYSF